MLLRPLPRPTARIRAALFERAVHTPPVIVAGMHRSGTGLLGRVLEALGVFMGADQSRNAESKLFQYINRDTLHGFGSSWRSTSYLPSTNDLEGLYDTRLAEIQSVLRWRLIRDYWDGVVPLLMRGRLDPWGWKDPLNSLLLPLWHRLFPEARLITIVRDGRDVVLSLLDRDTRYAGGDALSADGEAQQRVAADLKLWETYNRRIDAAAPLFERHHALRFEQLLEEPEREFDRLAAFLGRPAEPGRKMITQLIDASRTGRYEEAETSWRAFRSSRALTEYGYGLTESE